MSTIEELPERSRTVQQALAAADLDAEIITLPSSARTAAEAAAALDCEVGAIANSLVFVSVDADGNRNPLLVMTSGRHRVDTTALAATLGHGAIDRARAEEVRAATGQVIGGVAPVGHPAPLPTVIDIALADYPQLWAAGGTPHTLFAMTYDELIAITGGRVEQVGD
ncbi:YbaK/EbsC family protein [Microlunatus soli]|uniref:Cys-tRNA(Pro) deacylase, prolyl-tRNA editing enzyme YbaK/EbsC n=1 Tax=Microlunatus soli TaxID=630515 RepID=A0A1H1YG40_9ACTN|nr:YbaK/EbsC family protein [Microlunatus soli]SDT20397.1 Cys-tRNA(Pro) deacylase, prolyl-tRNA editing enzyme YbaK/EbsC [Microlunatus soli]